MQDILRAAAERLGIEIPEAEENPQSSSSEYEEQEYRRRLKLEQENAESVNHREGSSCPNCDGSGYIIVVKGDDVNKTVYTSARRCSCLDKKNTEWEIQRSGLAAMKDKYDFLSFKTKYAWQKEMKQKALKFIDAANDGEWFFISGQSGAGKTHICTALTTELIKKGMSGIYMLWREESSRLKGLRNDFSEYEKVLKKYISPKVLYVDDFLNCGEGKPTDADLRLAYELLNKRYMDKSCITVFSSEFYLNEIMGMSSALGGRIFERARDFVLGIPRRDETNIRVELAKNMSLLED